MKFTSFFSTFVSKSHEMDPENHKINCKLIKVNRFDDARGTLCFATGEKDFPFEIKRMFWITDVPEGASRGEHAHFTCYEAIFPVSGGFDIFIDDGENRETFTVNSPCEGIVVPPKVWCRLFNFRPNTVCVVAASESYNSEGYVHDYASFLKRVKCE